jgi:putative ABC transport system ATP-binding protein
MITARNLRKVYRVGTERVVALDNINLQIPKGEICCILGPSGSGKSTLLNQLAGLEKPTAGDVLIGKKNISRMSENMLAGFRQRNIGFIFQSYNLLAALTAVENVSLPLMFRGLPRGQRDREAVQILRRVGLGDRLRHKPSEMSGGQQQRVAIARAFVARPRLIFADEPTGNLDSKTTREIIRMLVDIIRENGHTFVLVTHNSELAAFADRVITLRDGAVLTDLRQQPLLPHPAAAAPDEDAGPEDPPDPQPPPADAAPLSGTDPVTATSKGEVNIEND